MRSLLLHVGPWKTASTTIQKFLHAGRLQLLHEGFLFPCEDLNAQKWRGLSANHSHMLTGALERDLGFSREAKHGFKNIKMDAKPAAELLSRIVHDDLPNVILSAEDLSALSPEDFMQLVDLASAAGRETKVLGMARGPASYVSSMVQQMVMGRDFLLSDLLLDLPFPKYRSWFEKFLTTGTKTTIEPFVTGAHFHTSPLGVLSRWLALPDDFLPEARKLSSRVSAGSKSLPAVLLKSSLNEFSKELELSAATVNELGAHSRVLPGPKFEIPGEVIKSQEHRAEADVAWLKDNFDISYLS